MLHRSMSEYIVAIWHRSDMLRMTLQPEPPSTRMGFGPEVAEAT